MQASIHFREDCLINTFAISRENAEKVMAILRECKGLLESEEYSCHYSHEIALALRLVSPLINGHGEEGFLFEGQSNIGLHYVNMGDPYRTTIVWRDEDSSFSLGCWGSFLEDYETRFPSDEEEEESVA